MWWWINRGGEEEAMVGCNELCGHTATLDYDKVITFCIHNCHICNENKEWNVKYKAIVKEPS